MERNNLYLRNLIYGCFMANVVFLLHLSSLLPWLPLGLDAVVDNVFAPPLLRGRVQHPVLTPDPAVAPGGLRRRRVAEAQPSGPRKLRGDRGQQQGAVRLGGDLHGLGVRVGLGHGHPLDRHAVFSSPQQLSKSSSKRERKGGPRTASGTSPPRT